MPIGPLVRRAFGPYERTVANLWRGMFFNVDRFVSDVAANVPARSILEVGCGEGAVSERLAAAYPDAMILGIDITDRVGRLFQGDRSRVTFRRATIQELSAEKPPAFDLVLFADVVHHIPPDLRDEILAAACSVIKPGGRLVLKDWERGIGPAHWCVYFLDRVITGDRVRFETAEYFRSLIGRSTGAKSVEPPRRYPPWSNNIAFFTQVG